MIVGVGVGVGVIVIVIIKREYKKKSVIKGRKRESYSDNKRKNKRWSIPQGKKNVRKKVIWYNELLITFAIRPLMWTRHNWGK